jgi:hypothetical protein
MSLLPTPPSTPQPATPDREIPTSHRDELGIAYDSDAEDGDGEYDDDDIERVQTADDTYFLDVAQDDDDDEPQESPIIIFDDHTKDVRNKQSQGNISDIGILHLDHRDRMQSHRPLTSFMSRAGSAARSHQDAGNRACVAAESLRRGAEAVL